MFKRVLVTLDGSEFSEAVLPYVRDFCLGTDAHVILLRVADMRDGAKTMETPYPVAAGGAGVEAQPRETVDQRLDRLADEIETYLEDRAKALRGAGASVETEVLFSDAVAHSIVEYARGAEIDVIMMSTHGRTGLAGVLLGSIAAKVMRAWRKPVLLVCPGDENREP